MDLKRLQILRELADRGTVAATAVAMNVTPSAVSQQLKVLQEEVGIELVERVGRRVRLTEAGLAMAGASAELSAAMERVKSTVDLYRRGWQTDIRAAFFPSAAEMLLPGLLTRMEELDGVHLEAVLEDPSMRDFPLLTADYDFVLAHSIEGVDMFIQPGIVVVPLMHEPLDVAMPAGHPLTSREVVTPEEVVDYPWVGIAAGFPFDTVLSQIEVRAGRLATRIQKYPDLRVMEALVAAGHGLAMLPRYTARGHISEKLELRELTDVRARRSIAVLMRKDVSERTSVRRVVEMLQAEAAAIVTGAENSVI